jgi:hypothetical protein
MHLLWTMKSTAMGSSTGSGNLTGLHCLYDITGWPILLPGPQTSSGSLLLLHSTQRICRVEYVSTRAFVLSVPKTLSHAWWTWTAYEGVTKSFRTGRLERELQMVQLSATRCSYIAILWVSLVSFVVITLCVSSQRVFIVVVYFVIVSFRKLLDTHSYTNTVFSDG